MEKRLKELRKLTKPQQDEIISKYNYLQTLKEELDKEDNCMIELEDEDMVDISIDENTDEEVIDLEIDNGFLDSYDDNFDDEDAEDIDEEEFDEWLEEN